MGFINNWKTYSIEWVENDASAWSTILTLAPCKLYLRPPDPKVYRFIALPRQPLVPICSKISSFVYSGNKRTDGQKDERSGRKHYVSGRSRLRPVASLLVTGAYFPQSLHLFQRLKIGVPRWLSMLDVSVRTVGRKVTF